MTNTSSTSVVREGFSSDPPTPDDVARAAELTRGSERLAPTFIKLGQLLSTRADLLPPAYLDALERLQDNGARGLPDGRAVAVKVLRPHIREIVRDDIAALQRLLGTAQRYSETAYRFDLQSLLDEFRWIIGRELDYRAEAVYLERLAANLHRYPELVIPRPIPSHSTSRVLCVSSFQPM